MKFSTRSIVLTGLLAALTIALSTTILGFIPVPSPAGAMTTVHLPVIIGGIALGPYLGSLLGLIFGLFTLRFMADPFVVILPRLLIGPVSYLVYRLVRRGMVGAAASAAAGTLTNTVGVLTMAVLRGYMPVKAALGIAAFNGTIEVVVAVVVIPPIVKALAKASMIPSYAKLRKEPVASTIAALRSEES